MVVSSKRAEACTTNQNRDVAKLSETAVVILGLAIFLALCLYQIELPGLHYDEAKEAGVPAMQLLSGEPVEAFRGAGLHLFSRLFPLMVQDYIGAISVYLTLPFLLCCRNVPTLRLMPVTFAALTLLFTYLFARDLFNRRTAAITYLLLALNPSFVFWSRQGVFVTSITTTLALASLVCLLRWYRGGRSRHLYLGALALGLGLYAKLLFLWFIGALVATFIILDARRLLTALGQRSLAPFTFQINPKQMALAFLCFISGLCPLIVYNLQTVGTLSTVASNLRFSYYGVNNLAFLPNLIKRLNQFNIVMEGGHFWYLGGTFVNSLWPYLFYSALAATVLVVLLRAREEGRRALFPFLMIAFIIVGSCFTVSDLWFTHYAILTPLPPLALANALDLLARRGGLGRAGLIVALAAVILGLADLRVDWLYHRALSRSGGLSYHSDASYELADYLQEHNLVAPLAMDWGIAAPVQFLTQGQVRPIEVFGYNWEPDEAFGQRLAGFLVSSDSVYIFHSPEETKYDRRDAFNELVARAGKVSREEKIISDRSGKPIFLLIRATAQTR